MNEQKSTRELKDKGINDKRLQLRAERRESTLWGC